MLGSSTNEPFVFNPAAVGTSHAGNGQAPGSFSTGSVGGNTRHSESDSLVRQTQREITQLLRELAAAARDSVSVDQFLSMLCDRTLRAMSAEGVVVWQSSSNSKETEPNLGHRYHPVARLGRVTDQNILMKDDGETDGTSSPAWLAHQTLLETVYADSSPVVVPSTPNPTEHDVPVNPTGVPAALVVIDGASDRCKELPHRIIEVFLEAEGGIAAQRGYLRFVCQVADLAGEYFRTQQLRSLLDQQTLAEQCDHAIARLQKVHDRDEAVALIVDQLAEIFQIDRLAITQQRSGSKIHIIAVSHVESVDQHSDSAQQIRDAAGQEIMEGSAFWFPKPRHNDTESDASKMHSNMLAMYPLVLIAGEALESGASDHGYRLVGLCRNQSGKTGLESFQQRELIRVARYAIRWIENLDQFQWPRWRRWVGSSASSRYGTARGQSGSQSLMRRIWQWACCSFAALVLVIVMVIPVPKNIQAPATLRAKDTWRACAIRDCVVEAIHVDHGQSVESGEVLMTLSDPNLDQQRTQLVGRRAVLAEQKIRLTEQMMSSSTSDFDEYESIQSQRGIVDEEIAAVNQQMSLLDRIQETMTIRSDRDGTVDAWQIHKRLGGRPVSRGDVLMQVVSTNSQWVVDAEVAQNRIGRVQNADQQHELSAVVTLVELPGEVLIASQWEFGPTSQSSVPGQASTEVTLVLDIGQEDETHQNVGTLRSGSPAKVLFHCGDVPLADLLVGDLYREIKTTLAMHWNVTAANDQTLRGKETP